MIDRMAKLRAGFLTTRSCGPDGIYELKVTFQSLDDLDAADQELRDALERERIDLGPLTALASRPEAPPASASPATVAQPVDQADLEYENEHPAARRMRLDFEAKYGQSSALMRAANHWFNLRTQWNEAWNRDREEPITEADVAQAERAMLAAQPCPSQGCGGDGGVGAPFGIIDPDYARIFTKARILAWQYGYALVMHGSFTRDLDLLLVPWEQRAFAEAVPRIVKMLAEQCDLKIRADDPADKPHGRKCWSLHLPGFGEPRWVDLSVMPARAALSTDKGDGGSKE